MTPAARACLIRLTGDRDPPSDSELLARYTAGRDGRRVCGGTDRGFPHSAEEAFAELVRRHGPVVLAACRRVLGPSPDAEDAFQAVFLALAREAGAVREPTALPAWLHRAALRVARRALARRRPAAPLPAEVPDPADPADPLADVAWRDLRRVLDEELDRLPETYRTPLILCLLGGLTRDEAAARLGWSLGTLKRRLDAGRGLLRARLLRRGVSPVALAASALGPGGLTAAVPDSLAAAVVRLAAPGAAAPPAVRVLLAAGWWRVGLAGALAAVATAAAVVVGSSAGPAPTPSPPPGEPVADPAPAPRPAVIPGDPLPKGVTARFGSLRYRAPGCIYTTASSPDGKLLAVSTGREVHVYDASTWTLLRTITADDGEGTWASGRNLAFSPDGRYLGFARSGKSVYLLDLRTGQAGPWFGDGDRLRWAGGCVFTPDGLLGVADRKRAYFYDPATGREVRSTPTGGTARLSPAGDTFVRMARDAPGDVELVLCDARTGRELHRFDGTVRWGNGAEGFAFAPDGKTLALLPDGGKELHLWDVAARKRVAALAVPGEPYPDGPGEGDVGYTADGRTVFVRLTTGDLARWDVKTAKELPRLVAGPGPPLGGLHHLPDGKTVLTPSYPDGLIRVWDAATGAEVPVPGRYRSGLVLALSPDGRTVAAADDTGRIDLLDAATGRPVRELRAKGDSAGGLVFSPDGRLIAVAERRASWSRIDLPHQVRVLRVADGGEVRAVGLERGNDARSSGLLGFSPDGRELVAGHGRLRSVDIETGKEVASFELPPPGAVARPALSPDGRRVAVADGDLTSVREVTTGKEVWRAPVAAADKNPRWAFDGCHLAWSADGKVLLCARPPDLVVVHDADTGREKHRFWSYPDGYPPNFDYLVEQARLLTTAVALSPDGRRAATVGWRGPAVLVWDVATGKVIAKLANGFGVDGVAFTPDGRAVLSWAGLDGGIGYRWDLDAVIANR